MPPRAVPRVSLFQNPPKSRPVINAHPVTIKDFSGGWDASDDDEILATKYAAVLQNMQVGMDGSINLRYGTFRFAMISGVVTGNIINITYFNGYIIAVTSTGQIAAVDGSGNVTAIWNSTIAAALPGAPSGWPAITMCTFVPFRKELIIHNGVSKPVTIAQNLHVTYLQDLATGSNVNVPIGSFGCAVSNYHCVAGIPATPTIVVVSSVSTSGTFPNDPAPNDAISFDVGAYTSISTAEIRGIAGYRNWLMIFFRDSTLVITLGNYVSSVHTPEYSDSLAKVGLLSQRDIVYVDNNIVFAAPTGVHKGQRNLYAGLIQTNPLSEVVTPGYNTLARNMTAAQETGNTFAVHDILNRTLYVFLNGTAVAYTFSDDLRVHGWATATNWPWVCACTSAQGRVFFGLNTKIYQLGNSVFPHEEVYGDYTWDYDVRFVTTGLSGPANQKVFDPALFRMWVSQVAYSIPAGPNMLTYVENNPTMWVEDFGTPIPVNWELPWLDFKDPERIKHIRTIKIGSKGTAHFTVNAYVDGLYKDQFGAVIYNPALTMPMIANSQQGFGASSDQPFGSGRRSADPRLYKFPLKFKRMKIQVTGNLYRKFKVFWFTFLMVRGSYHRP